MSAYRVMTAIGVLLFAALFVAYTFAPGAMMGAYGVRIDAAGAFVAHRTGGAMLGIAVMLALALRVTDRAARTAIMTGCAVICGYLAGLGTFEFARGHAGQGIFGAVAVEVLLAAGFLYAATRKRAA